MLKDSLNFLHGKKEVTNEPPGTLSYNGLYKNVPVYIECIEYTKTTYEEKKLDSIHGPFDPDKVYWFNIVGLHDISLIKEIGHQFNLHPMDLEDIVHVSQWSKIEPKPHYLFSIFKMASLSEQRLTYEHLSILLHENVILTFQEVAGDPFNDVRTRLKEGYGNARNYGGDYLYYALLDALVDSFFPILQHLSETIKNIELKIFDSDPKGRQHIYTFRKDLLHVMNAVAPISDSLTLLVNQKTIPKSMLPYYHDLLDHLHQIVDVLKSYKEVTANLHEMQIANASNDMNKTMMTLTIFSAIFIPLSFLAGVFGMNFSHMPGVNSPYGFYAFLFLCLAITVSMLVFFKLKHWD